MHLVVFASLFLVTFSASSSARTAASPPYFSRVWITINHYLFFQELALQLYQPRQISPTSKTSVDDKHLSPNLSSLERGEDIYYGYARPAFFAPKNYNIEGGNFQFYFILGGGMGGGAQVDFLVADQILSWKRSMNTIKTHLVCVFLYIQFEAMAAFFG